jgi:hypothetical protein
MLKTYLISESLLPMDTRTKHSGACLDRCAAEKTEALGALNRDGGPADLSCDALKPRECE